MEQDSCQVSNHDGPLEECNPFDLGPFVLQNGLNAISLINGIGLGLMQSKVEFKRVIGPWCIILLEHDLLKDDWQFTIVSILLFAGLNQF